MTFSVTRRTLLAGTAGSAALFLARGAAAAERLEVGAPEPFSFERLVKQARALAGGPYTAPPSPAPEVTEAIDYAAHGAIRFRTALAPFADGEGHYPVTFFHLGRFFKKTVRMHLVEDGQAREVIYNPRYFDMPADSPAHELPRDSGFAGFRFQEAGQRDDWRTQDWLAFLGASYFRAIGALGQYGLSARGVAVNVAGGTGEEFPDFTAFYIGPADGPEAVQPVWALLEGPSLTGAFHFACRRGFGVIMDVEARLFVRRDIERLGIAPLTSMFWYGEHGRERLNDWRPEVHDSDGLALWTGNGERLWRPLENPPTLSVSSFLDTDPKGFGLMQRDRNFDHYLDGVNYERRPSLWVEPLGQWGKGAVQLVELPTDDEIHDNIVAFWVPAAPARAGQELRFDYRLHWLDEHPYPPAELALTAATRLGRGGEPGNPRPPGLHKFVVEFEGRPLKGIPWGIMPKPVITASRGEVSYVFAEPIPNTTRWRAQWDLSVEGSAPVELRLYMELGGRPLTETWLYQFRPPGG
ncbi:glucan biosynthesis protein D [Geminicoccaceae bacterium 1502E]|nr:glucan biosynthesis protein D [Geminicoccaceae bacterium 1502E]